MPEFTAMTWNLHGKSLQAVQNLVDRTEDPWDFLIFAGIRRLFTRAGRRVSY